MWEDPIVREVREVREKLFARFDYDLEAYAAHIEQLEAHGGARGVRFADPARAVAPRGKPDAA